MVDVVFQQVLFPFQRADKQVVDAFLLFLVFFDMAEIHIHGNAEIVHCQHILLEFYHRL